MATIVRKIKEGPKTPTGQGYYPGLPYGAPTVGIANVTVSADGVRLQNGFAVATSWIQEVLLKDNSYNLSTLTYADYFALWAQSKEQFGAILDAENPNLEAFRDAGGKLLTWHGINDQLIPYGTILQYRKRVELEMGGAKSVDEFYRLFLAPGVMHCGLGVGPAPKDPLEKLVDWVEKGEPPETLEAETTNAEGERVTRDLCRWPRKSVYMGVGEGKRASSWSCQGGHDEEEAEEVGEKEQITKTGDFVGGLMDKLSQGALGLGLKVGT
jgi:hypothetical protein